MYNLHFSASDCTCYVIIFWSLMHRQKKLFDASQKKLRMYSRDRKVETKLYFMKG